MVVSAGIAIIYGDKVLLAHPSKADDKMWGIPKGKIEDGETLEETASRETMEEIGVYVDPKSLKDPKEIRYRQKSNRKTYKKVYYYIHQISSLDEIGLSSTILDQKQLQLKEVDKARFMTVDEAKDIIFWRQKEILNFVDEKRVA